jgi:hypothetical protein
MKIAQKRGGTTTKQYFILSYSLIQKNHTKNVAFKFYFIFHFTSGNTSQLKNPFVEFEIQLKNEKNRKIIKFKQKKENDQ